MHTNSHLSIGNNVIEYVEDGVVVKKLEGLHIIETTYHDGDVSMEYEFIGPEGAESLAWMKAQFPATHFFNRLEDEARAYESFIKMIQRSAVDDYIRTGVRP